MRTGRGVSSAFRRLAILVVIESAAVGQTITARAEGGPEVGLGDLIIVTTADGRLLDAIDEAIAMWQVCPQFGTGFPRIARTAPIAEPAEWPEEEPIRQRISVTFDGGFARGSLCGTFRGDAIVIYRSTLAATRQLRSCGEIATNLAHEIGHALGMSHPSHQGYEAVQSDGGVMAGTIGPGSRLRPMASAAECREVDRRWLTSQELAEARTLGLADPARTFGRDLVEVAEAWHEIVYGIDSVDVSALFAIDGALDTPSRLTGVEP